MLQRKPIFPNVIELNHQVGRIIGCNVYILFDEDEWALVDIGYEEDVDEIIELIRQLDFPLAKCKLLIATHADVDHVQGMAKAKQLLRAPVAAHPSAAALLAAGDKLQTFAEILALGIKLEMPVVETDRQLNEGDVLEIGQLRLEVWHTPGHTKNQLSFRFRDLLLSGDNIYRDGCVGAIESHHGSDLPDFIKSLERIRDSQAKWLLPSHGPVFANDKQLLNQTIERLQGYARMADFGACAVEWPLMDQWEKELAEKLANPNE
jgi:glyoxylase-like metal-dependent hydrolase (beta-lactamase superfamily II)